MLDVAALRSQFPALTRTEGGRPVAYLDGPGGTQVPAKVIEAMRSVLEQGVSNLGGPFATSRHAETVTQAAREAMADLVGADDPECIVFGQNMTSLTFAFSRALARTWRAGDRIVVTSLDHDANVTPWVRAAEERGVEVAVARFEGYELAPEAVAAVLTERTRLVAVTAASNALGTIPDVTTIVGLAHDAGALVYVDAVHYALHGPIDVAATGTDFLAASAYKFFGPHIGFVYGRRDLLEHLEPYKVRPAPSAGAGRWETGTQSFESLAGATAAVDHLAALGRGDTRRGQILSAHALIETHTSALVEHFLNGLGRGVTLHGIPSPRGRTPTFAVTVAGMHPDETAAALAAQGIYAWSGHYYAVEPMKQLGLLDTGGAVRIGFVPTTTVEEVDRVLAALESAKSEY